ncbi:hypothetical protein [Erythrobacter sp. AP23]|uniref:hypothetical protein n=1 Tax=Erythrobacter sp. AP23 TaxID=499656 RepID=UPI00076C0280|nr:hypothetical protein [Erythrobacter sp. AP23]KWV95453.1 hypothetical protein ASS64_05535 [Erythrobacter sp. AP23]
MSDVQSDPEWIPHGLDLQKQVVEFVKVPRETFCAPGFLFDYEPPDPTGRQWIPFDQIANLAVDTSPVHFIFHTAFCRSTLLARALNIPGTSIGMSEPGIIAALASAGPRVDPLVAPLVRLLGRKREGVGAVFVKPTNHANRLIGSLLKALPEARAILMSNSVSPFLQSVRKRGLMGHRWARRLYLELQRYAGLNLGMSAEEQFSMTDLQAGGVAWLLSQNLFTILASSEFGERVRTLDGDFFNENRGETIQAALGFAGIEWDQHTQGELEDHDAFADHAKLGGPVIQTEADRSTMDEIGQVEEWLALIANQIGIEIPVRQTLL